MYTHKLSMGWIRPILPTARKPIDYAVIDIGVERCISDASTKCLSEAELSLNAQQQ